MSAPDFSQATKDTLSARAAMMCNNPDCSCLTVGPSDGKGPLASKIGEAAHICAARPGARYDPSMTDDQRAAIDNGIWLCASCHTLIDKNDGADFPKDLLRRWKDSHEKVVRGLLLSHRSPLPILRRFTDDGNIAQEAIDIMEGHGALYEGFHMEIPQHVVASFDRLRGHLATLIGRVEYDDQLKQILKNIRDEFRKYMNITGNFQRHDWAELESVRNHVGILINRLVTEYGCKVSGRLGHIMP
jgi:hypothetical protein